MGDQNNYGFPIPTQNVSMYDDVAGYVRISQGELGYRKIWEDIVGCMRKSQDM